MLGDRAMAPKETEKKTVATKTASAAKPAAPAKKPAAPAAAVAAKKVRHTIKIHVKEASVHGRDIVLLVGLVLSIMAIS